MRNVARLSENDRRELFRNTADKMGLNIISPKSRYRARWHIPHNFSNFKEENIKLYIEGEKA